MALAKSALFNTVPEEDYLQLFPKGHIDGKKVVDFLKYKKADVAAATNVPESTIRYEPQKMPIELKERFELAHALQWGLLPELRTLDAVQDKENFLYAYAHTYLKEEIL